MERGLKKELTLLNVFCVATGAIGKVGTGSGVVRLSHFSLKERVRKRSITIIVY